LLVNLAETHLLRTHAGQGPEEQVRIDVESGIRQIAQVRQKRVADPARIVGSHDTQVNVGLRYAGAAAVESRKNLDDVFELVADRDRHHVLVSNLPYAIESGVDLHRVHAVAETLNLHLPR